MSRLAISPRSRQDLLEIWTYIARDNVTAADRFLDGLQEQFQRLSMQPQMGEARSDLASGLRIFNYRGYVICFRPQRTGVEIVRVLHGARRWEAELRA